MKLDRFASQIPLAFLAACSTVATAGPGASSDPLADQAAPAVKAAAAPAVSAVSAGNLAGAAAPSVDAAEIARLRAEGPAALERLLVKYDRMHAESLRPALAATIDKVAGQRYATVSRLYWYTDLVAAKAVAKASGKPILSLRMLGRLDEDLSCANSRFFRTTLYPDAAVGKLLREQFVLHWSSERLVPKVTIDFGDGRTIESTVTGNSAHYVLDADGRPIDALPGLYAPQVFARELAISRVLHASLRGHDDRERARLLAAHHRGAAERTMAAWNQLGSVAMIEGGRTLLSPAAVDGALAAGQRATMSKAYVEVPLLKTVDVGADPGKLPDDVALWAEIGQRLLGLGDPPAVPPGGFNRWGIEAPVPPRKPARPSKGRAPVRPILDAQARGLVDALLAATGPGVAALDEQARAAVISRLEQTIVADSALNEVQLRPMIRAQIAYVAEMGAAPDFAALNEFVYESVFHAPRADEWSGLLPRDTFTGLPGGAIVATQN